MTSFVAMGLVLGLSAGVAPGPLLTLVVAETLRHGTRSGIKVALAPVITDLPIIVFSLWVLAAIADMERLLGGITLTGALVVAGMGVSSLRSGGVGRVEAGEGERSLAKGVMINALSPHPYLFWLTVGAPTATRAYAEAPLSAIGFVGGFYLLLVGSKMALAGLAGRSRQFLSGKAYIRVMRFLGLLLLVFAVILLRDGMGLLA